MLGVLACGIRRMETRLKKRLLLSKKKGQQHGINSFRDTPSQVAHQACVNSTRRGFNGMGGIKVSANKKDVCHGMIG